MNSIGIEPPSFEVDGFGCGERPFSQSLSILPMILLGRQLRLRPLDINRAIGLAALHPFLIYYSRHTRMYSLLLRCALTSLWPFHRTINPRTRGVGLAYFSDSGERHSRLLASLRLADRGAGVPLCAPVKTRAVEAGVPFGG